MDNSVNTVKNGTFCESDEFQLVAKGLHKTYTMGPVKVPVLNGVNLSVREGEFVSIIGQSGSGKSTLLHLLGTLDVPDEGTIYFDGQRIDRLPNGQRDILRNRFIGMIFQFYHLLPELTTLENVLSPLMIRYGIWEYLFKSVECRKRGTELLKAVGLSHRLRHKPNELSGGEMQRAAIARALISEPQILFADEPTGNLDSKTAQEIIHLLRVLNEEHKLTIVMVTHDLAVARNADRMVQIVDGRITLD
ncbi:MAG: ABC transporter ATP-binding protein [Thermoguttaceae bacterium]